jgi:putative ABC transport system permease protein
MRRRTLNTLCTKQLVDMWSMAPAMPSVHPLSQTTRHQRPVRLYDSSQMLNDFRFALRSLRRRPTFSATVFLTLALGIGTSTAVFSLLDAALIRPLPFKDPSRIAMMWGVAGPQRTVRGASHREIMDWRELNRSFADVAAYDEISLNLRTSGEPRRVEAEMVSASYFDIVGAVAARGRTFTGDEDRVPDARPVAVISHAMWTTQFGGDPGIVGRSITLNDRPVTIVGVTREGFRGISFDTDVWVPMMMMSLTTAPSTLENRGNRWLGAVGRLKPGVTMADAQRDLNRVAERLAAAFPESNRDRGVRLFSLQDAALGTTRDLLVALFAAVMVFLGVACANVMNLQLVRATSRRREMALRVAVGADRGSLLRQLLAEGLTLAAFGAIGGVLFAVWGLGALLPLLPPGALPPWVAPSVDWRVLAFATVLTLACGVLFGLAPALETRRLAIGDALKEGARSAAGGITTLRRVGFQQVLVVCEVALALMLLVGGGLMLRSLQRQLAVDPGFRASGVVTAQISLPRQYGRAAVANLGLQLVERLRALPQVQSVALGSDVPLGGNTSAASIYIDGVTDTPVRYYRHRVTPDYFTALGIPLVRGRTFTPADRDSTPLVVVVTEAMAQRYWPNADAVGRRIRFGDATGTEATIVGVVATARFRDLTSSVLTPASEPDVFLSFAQRPDGDFAVVVRTADDPATLTNAIQRELSAIDPGIPLYHAAPLADLLGRQTAAARFGSTLLGTFSIVALLLAAIGIYGVLAFVIGLSRREIAIRLALGATVGRVIALIVRQSMRLVAVGLAVGLAGAYLASGLLSTQLFGVSATDPVTFGVVALLVLGVAVIASYLPSRTAARVDPQLALKSD